MKGRILHNDGFIISSYGAQNEAYMSRSAEKWVRGLCFNELGVGGWNDGVKRSVYIGLHLVYFRGLLRLLWFTWGLRVVYIAFLLVLGVVLGWGRMVAEATFFMAILKFDNAKLFHIMNIWYICRNKTSEYGKGYTRASAAQYRGDEAERLVFQQHFCGLYGFDGWTDRGNEELSAPCRAVGQWYIMHETRYNQAIYAHFVLSWGRWLEGCFNGVRTQIKGRLSGHWLGGRLASFFCVQNGEKWEWGYYWGYK